MSHDVSIGDYVEISPGVKILGHAKIGDFTSIGTNAVVLPRVSIGKNCIVVAGAVVTKNVDDNTTVVGIPAKSRRFKAIMIELTPENEDEIKKYWTHSDKIYVSCVCITFNHQNFIKDCIDSMLAQCSDYKFEIVIHDDKSNDGTRDILLDYKARFPTIIKLILQDENQYSKGNKPLTIVSQHCSGEFIALCEGDDYWRDSKKIDTQAKYLIKNPDIFITSHDAIIIDARGNIKSKSKLPYKYHRDFKSEELILGKAWLLTLNWMFRNESNFNIPEYGKIKNGDTFLTSFFGNFGGSHHHTDIISSAYRVHEGGVWSLLNENERQDAYLNSLFWIYKYYNRLGLDLYANCYWLRFSKVVMRKTSMLDVIKVVLSRMCITPLKKLKAKLYH